MNTLEALNKRKSIRGYLNQPVEEEKLKKILELGNKAPHACPFHMSVIRNKDILRKINDTFLEVGKVSGNDFIKQRLSIPGYQPLYGAPILIVLSAPEMKHDVATTACAVTNMSIAATELGLGSCYLAGFLMAFKELPELYEDIGIPEGFMPKCGMIIGYESTEQIPEVKRVGCESNINFVD